MHWFIIHRTHIPFIALNYHSYRLISSQLFAYFFLFFRFQNYTASTNDLRNEFPNGAKSVEVYKGTWVAFGKVNFQKPDSKDLTEGHTYNNPEAMSLSGPIYSIEIKPWDIVSSW